MNELIEKLIAHGFELPEGLEWVGGSLAISGEYLDEADREVPFSCVLLKRDFAYTLIADAVIEWMEEMGWHLDLIRYPKYWLAVFDGGPRGEYSAESQSRHEAVFRAALAALEAK